MSQSKNSNQGEQPLLHVKLKQPILHVKLKCSKETALAFMLTLGVQDFVEINSNKRVHVIVTDEIPNLPTKKQVAEMSSSQDSVLPGPTGPTFVICNQVMASVVPPHSLLKAGSIREAVNFVLQKVDWLNQIHVRNKVLSINDGRETTQPSTVNEEDHEILEAAVA